MLRSVRRCAPVPRLLFAIRSNTTEAPKSERDYTYDVCVIGAGPAGYAAAIRGWDFGLKVCLVERGELGGAGVHNGALSSKAMWQIGRRFTSGKEAYGVWPPGTFEDIVTLTKASETAKFTQMQQQLEKLYRPQPGTPGGSITRIKGQASFVNKHTIEVDHNFKFALNPPRNASSYKGAPRRITASNFIIATGSSPRVLPQFPVDGEVVINSDHIMRLKNFPKKMVIIGGGVIGCEFASIFSTLRDTEVHLLNERRSRLLPDEDPDLTDVITNNLCRSGVSVHNDVKLLKLKRVGDHVEYEIGKAPDFVSTGVQTADVALFAVGRVPNTSELNLQAAGVTLSKRSGIEVDEQSRSLAKHIFAAGDVTADIGLVNIAEMEGRYCMEQIARALPSSQHFLTSLCYDNVSTIMFLTPEVACVGMNEQEARRRRIPHRTAVIGLNIVNRAIINNVTDKQLGASCIRAMAKGDHSDYSTCNLGFVKMVVSCDKDMKLLGMRAVGDDASAIIETAAFMIQEGLPIKHLAKLLHPHPAITEAVQECVRMLLGNSIYKPEVFTSCRITQYTGEEEPKAGVAQAPKALVPTYG